MGSQVRVECSRYERISLYILGTAQQLQKHIMACLKYTRCPSRSKQTVDGHCRVQDRVLVPGTAFFEIGSAAAATLAGSEQAVQLSQLAIHSPKLLALAAEESAPSLLCTVDCRSGSLSIASSGSSALCHVTAQAAVAAATQLQTHIVRQIPCLLPVSASAASMEPAQVGTMAQLSALHEGMAVGAAAFVAHPAQADAALHLGAVDALPGEAPRVPVGLDSMLCSGQQSCLHSSSGWAVAGENHPLFSKNPGNVPRVLPQRCERQDSHFSNCQLGLWHVLDDEIIEC